MIELINKNIRFLREKRGWSQKELAAKLDVKPPVIGSYEEFRAAPSISLAVKMAALFNVELDQLVKEDLGKGEAKKPKNHKYKRGANTVAVTLDSRDRENIQVVSQKASAGYLNGYADPEFITELPKISVPNLTIGTYRCFEIKGDSMLPVKEKDLIIGKYVEDFESIRNGSTYILVTNNEGIVYKRVFSFLGDDKLLLMSDNRAYDPYIIHVDDIMEAWEYRGRFTYEEEVIESTTRKSLDNLAGLLFEKLNN
jgi:transcriptional regulator with XRE-family HTH domain